MRDEDRRHLELVVQPPDLEPHFLAQIGVKIRQRFIEQQHRRFHDDRTRQRNTLLLAAAQLRRIAARQRIKSDRLQHLGNPALDRSIVQLAQSQSESHVFRDRLVRPQRIALEDHDHVTLFRR